MPTQQGLPVEEEQRLVERAKRFYEDELEDRLIEEHKGDIVAIDGYTLRYALGLNASGAYRELRRKCDRPVTYTARVGYDYVYYVPLSSDFVHGENQRSEPETDRGTTDDRTRYDGTNPLTKRSRTMPTQQGLPVEEEQRLVERAKRFYEDELEDRLIDEHKGDIVVIDGYTLRYAVAMNESGARQTLLSQTTKPVTYTARVGFDYVYYVPLPSTVLNGTRR